MNGQRPAPESWKEWEKTLSKAVKQTTMQLSLLIAQLEEAQEKLAAEEKGK